ncbi:glycosyltransferase [Lysobacter pythonis]|uniref:Glycosyltransferase n=1 Tax=Solilutibacter pythonis TaxID=2483112 RepID=A0A3M2I4S5_9GAMM|nr:glycosyltransferase family 2 protein [Lysobacter pythonis]RMH93234.1 glycosyltransferase [Lysobacter pythonis]
MKRVSLIVTTYNWPEALARCLHSIARQRHPPFEVVVADDGSGPATTALIERMGRDFPVPLRHAWQADAGFRAARVRNLGVAHAAGDHLVFVDGDLILHPRFVADHLQLARPGGWLQGGRLNSSQAEARRLLQGGRPRFSPWMPFASHIPGEQKPKHALRNLPLARLTLGRNPPVMSCNMGIGRDDFERVNGFDEAYEGWGREDDDIAARLAHAGIAALRVRYAALAIHLWHPTRSASDTKDERLPNDALLEEALATRRVRCERGLAGHARP